MARNLSPINENDDLVTKKYVDDSREVWVDPSQPAASPPYDLWVDTDAPDEVTGLDGRYVLRAGDTMAGKLIVPNATVATEAPNLGQIHPIMRCRWTLTSVTNGGYTTWTNCVEDAIYGDRFATVASNGPLFTVTGIYEVAFMCGVSTSGDTHSWSGIGHVFNPVANTDRMTGTLYISAPRLFFNMTLLAGSTAHQCQSTIGGTFTSAVLYAVITKLR